MQYYNVSYGQGVYKLHVGTKSAWKTLFSRAVEQIDSWSGDRFCSGFRRDWFWNHSFTRPRRDPEDNYLENSINSTIIDVFNHLLNVEWKSEKELHVFNVTPELARWINAKLVEAIESMDEDDNAAS